MTSEQRARIVGRKVLYPEGTRVRIVRWFPSPAIDDNVTVPVGTEGTVDHVDSVGTVFVRWDNGRRLGVCLDDELEPATKEN